MKLPLTGSIAVERRDLGEGIEAFAVDGYPADCVLIAAMAYAFSFATLPPADFTFLNGTEIQSVDPAITTGVPEGRAMDSALSEEIRGMLLIR